MPSYMCKHCYYTVETTTPKQSKKCPICGNNTIIEQPNAEELLLQED